MNLSGVVPPFLWNHSTTLAMPFTGPGSSAVPPMVAALPAGLLLRVYWPVGGRLSMGSNESPLLVSGFALETSDALRYIG